MSKQIFNATRATVFEFDPEDVVLPEDEDSPLYDPRVKWPISEAMVQHMEEAGVLAPITVRKGPSGKPEVIDGRRRVRHLRIANQRREKRGLPRFTVKCVVKQGDESVLLDMMIALNSHRLNDSPVGEARKAARMLNAGATERQTCLSFGWESASTLHGRLDLLKLDQALINAVDRFEMSAYQALQHGKLEPEQQREVAASVEGQKVKRGRPKGAKNTAPTRLRLRKLTERGEGVLSKDFLLGVRYAIGLVPEQEIPALAKVNLGKKERKG